MKKEHSHKRKLFSSATFVRLAFRLGKYLPLRAAPFVAAIGARIVMLVKPAMYRAARANVRHVLGEKATPRELDRTLYRLFCNTGRRYCEIFFNLGRNVTRAEDFRPPVKVAAETLNYIQAAAEAGHGLFILACHMSNFDLGGIALAQACPTPLQALSLADPPPDVEVFNSLRERGGVLITPISPQSLRDAITRLRAGGIAVTGPDYPTPEGDAPVMFFGAPARLPTGYIRIPLRTGSPVMIVHVHYRNGVYWVEANPPMTLIQTGNREQDAATNLQRVLVQVEDVIREKPEEWMMFLPVWLEDL